MRRIWQRLPLFAAHDAPVLVTGETGTGKEIVARALHELGPRRDGPFVAVNCGSIAQQLAESEIFGHERGAFTGADRLHRGFFEQAQRGTLLLDDVDDLPLALQVKLLRVLQERACVRVGGSTEVPVDVRVVATTKVDLQQAIGENRMREDLYYRLRGLELTLPPLRTRRDDILLLVRYFLAQDRQRIGAPSLRISVSAARLLCTYDWPGNVRELRRTIEAAAVLCQGGEIRPDHLPDSVRVGAVGCGAGRQPHPAFTLQLDHARDVRFDETVERFEDALIDWALGESDGQQLAAAKLLHLPRTTLQSKLRRRERARRRRGVRAVDERSAPRGAETSAPRAEPSARRRFRSRNA